MKRKLALICVASMMLSCLTGCGNAQNDVNDVKESSVALPVESTVNDAKETTSGEVDPASVEPIQELPISDGSITFKVAYPVNARVEDINTNTLTLYIEEKTGINLEFIELNTSDTASQVNAMMNGGDLPDIFIGYQFPYDALCSYADAGLLLPLDEYVDKWGYNLKNTMFADPDLGGEKMLAYGTYDGHLYAVPNGGALITNVYTGLLPYIQTYYLNELGMKKPETLDELRDFLMAVKEAYPEVTPMTAYANNNQIFNNISQAYQFTDERNFLKVTADGKVEFIGNNELFKEALQYAKGMMDDGLIDPAAWTQDQNTLSTYSAQDGYNVALYACGSQCSNVLDSASDEYLDLEKILALEGPYGYKSVQIKTDASNIRTTLVVTSACEYPEEAFRLFDFFLSDEFAIQARVGTEGEQWVKAEEGVLGRDGQQAWFSLLGTQEWVQPSTNVIWRDTSFYHTNILNHCDGGAGEITGEKAKYRAEVDAELLREVVTLNTNEGFPQLILDPEIHAEYTEVKNLIVPHVKTNIANFILGIRDLSEWDDYCAELEAMGVERYIELSQMGYDILNQ